MYCCLPNERQNCPVS